MSIEVSISLVDLLYLSSIHSTRLDLTLLVFSVRNTLAYTLLSVVSSRNRLSKPFQLLVGSYNTQYKVYFIQFNDLKCTENTCAALLTTDIPILHCIVSI